MKTTSRLALTAILLSMVFLVASSGQQKAGQTSEDELNAYRAIKWDLPFTKRAAMLLDFLEKYPNSKLLQSIDYQHIKMLKKDEYNAYRSAKREPDPEKRAGLLIEFLRKYPDSNLMEKEDQEAIRPLQDLYDAYDAAKGEPDPGKRAALLIEFHQKHPSSALARNVEYDYAEALKEASDAKRYDVLEAIAEAWLKVHPNDTSVYPYIAVSADHLQKYEKCAATYQEIYKLKPSPAVAREIYGCYQKGGNLAGQAEWAEKLSKMPEFKDDYTLQFDLVVKYSKDSNLSRAAEYAQRTLEAADIDRQPDPKLKEQLRKVHRISHHVIASDFVAKKNFPDAITAYREALKDEKYGEGYYGIGLCLDNQKQVEEANLYYAMSELMGGEQAPRAKSRLETLYKSLHNNTLVGLDKVYQKAKEALDGTAN